MDNPLIEEVLQKGEYAALALNDGNEPYILNLHYGYDNDSGKLYFITRKGGMKIDFLRSNSYICGSIVIRRVSEECAPVNYSSVVFRGVMEVIHNPQEKALALSLLASQPGYSPKGSSEENLMIMKLELEEIDGRRNP